MYVIGTAGHVDHGKSTLVQTLTGIDPDRLREEKERGMTIELGFAWLTLPSGKEVSIVDVPGHERFIKNMLAGVGGIDLALLVIAANESVMPQTREHLAILDLLRVQVGLVVISKKELVEEDMIDLVISEVEDVLKGTTLENAPVVTVSAVTGEGLPELLAKVDQLLEVTETRKDSGRPRISIDRSFTMFGFGTVVTGTLIDGSLCTGMDVEVLPSGKISRIRGLQSHRQKIDKATPGRRLAVNLSGISHNEIQRGDVLTIPGWLKPTVALDARLQLLASAPRALKHNKPVTFHTGTTETVARIRLLEKDDIYPGEETWAQIRLETPLSIAKGDYFVIRSSDVTLGGGSVVDPHAKRHRRRHTPTLKRLEIMSKGSQDDILLETIQSYEPINLHSLSEHVNISIDETRKLVENLASNGRVIILESTHISRRSSIYSAEGWSSLVNKTRDILKAYHKNYPLRRGIQKEELRSRLSLPAHDFAIALSRMSEENALVEETNSARLTEYEAHLDERQNHIVEQYVRHLQSDPYSPPTDIELDEDLLNMLVSDGKVVKVSETIIYDSDVYHHMVDTIVNAINEHGKINVGQVRDKFQTSRKYALSILEYLDQQRITRRVGDDRILR